MLVALVPAARAQPPRAPSHVLVVTPECPLETIDVVESLRLLRIELVGDAVAQVDLVTAAAPPADEPGRIAIVHLRVAPCAPDATAIEVIIDDAVTRKRVRRSLDAGGVPRDVRPRALALGIAELLRASWAELARVDPLEPAVPLSEETRAWLIAQARVLFPAAATEQPVALALASPEPPAQAPPPATPVPPAPRVYTDLAATLRTFPADGSALLGARLGVSFPLFPVPLRVGIDAAYARGRVRVELGDIAIGLASGALTLDLSSDPDGPFVIELGPRVEVGYGWASGTPVDPGDVGTDGGGVVAILSGHARFTGRVTGAWHALADLELGHTLAGLDATVDGRSTTGIAGPALAAHVGVRLEL